MVMDATSFVVYRFHFDVKMAVIQVHLNATISVVQAKSVYLK
jgi:hypothetical protein